MMGDTELPLPIPKSSFESIRQLYNSLTYTDTYGSTVLLFICITLLVFAIFGYFTVRANVDNLSADWVNQRCKPHIMPFAGLIQKEPGDSIGDATKRNFDYCTQSILTETTGTMLSPLTFITNSLTHLAEKLQDAINNIRNMISKVRDSMQAVSKEIMGRLLNMMIPLQQIIVSMRDMMGKIQGAMTAALFTVLGSYMTLKTLLGAIAEFIVTILIVFAALIAGLWAVPFTWGFAAANTAIFIAISVPMAIILSFMKNTMHIETGLKIPSVCFDGNTMLRRGARDVPIREIQPGDVLDNAMHSPTNSVTAIMKLAAPISKMYRLNGVLVTGDHLVWYEHSLRTVGSHPLAVYVPRYKEEYVYCLNTSDKNIYVQGTRGTWFSDWDGLTDHEYAKLREVCLSTTQTRSTKSRNNFHECFDGGFFGNVPVRMGGGNVQAIRDICVGDVLDKNIVVYGTVRVCAKQLNSVATTYGYNINWMTRHKDDNCAPTNTNPGDSSSIVYHLLTSTRTFNVDGREVMDYNACIDRHLPIYH